MLIVIPDVFVAGSTLIDVEMNEETVHHGRMSLHREIEIPMQRHLFEPDTQCSVKCPGSPGPGCPRHRAFNPAALETSGTGII